MRKVSIDGIMIRLGTLSTSRYVFRKVWGLLGICCNMFVVCINYVET